MLVFSLLFIFAIGTLVGSGCLLLILQLLAANPLVFPGGPVAPVVDLVVIVRSTLSLLAVKKSQIADKVNPDVVSVMK